METTTKYQVKEVTWPGKTFVVKKATLSFDKLTAFFNESYKAIYAIIGKHGMTSTEAPCAIYYSVDEKKNTTELAAAVPVHGAITKAEGFDVVNIPQSKALQLTYYGSYEDIGPAYEALEKYVRDHKLKKQWMLEEYHSDPAKEKDPANWKTNIYFVLG